VKDRDPSFDPSKLTQHRKDKGLTQRDLAAAVGISQANVAELERGKRPPAADVLVRIAEALSLNADLFKRG
jgi:transcriptional regulator with XRE-family HTH domain